MGAAAGLHGILVVDKPKGWTSHDVVARVRRIAGQRQVGHGGTLDPMATGVLALGLGQGTRLLEFVSDGRKTYEATVRFGAATDSYDADGSITVEADWRHVTEDGVRKALAGFVGDILQRPPAFSAIKRAGVPLYQLARRGEHVEVEPREVTVFRLEVIRLDLPDLELIVECSSGTYVRSLAHDLGQTLGSAAYLTSLRRTAAGTLGIADAVALETLDGGGRELLALSLLALDRPVWRLPAIIVNSEHARDAIQGRKLPTQPQTVDICRAYGANGDFLALLRYDAAGSYWQPHKVFTAAADIAAVTEYGAVLTVGGTVSGEGRDQKTFAGSAGEPLVGGHELEAYCVKCRDKREMSQPKQITMKNGKPAVQGKCPVCGTTMNKIGATV